MKTFLVIFILVIEIVINILVAQPAVVTKALKQKFPTAENIKWIKEDHKNVFVSTINGKTEKQIINYDNTWKANFLLGGRKTSAVFDQDGHWLTAQQEIKLEEIGFIEAITEIKKDFSACQILSVKINNSACCGTWYDVEGQCGIQYRKLSYDWQGSYWPPKQ